MAMGSERRAITPATFVRARESIGVAHLRSCDLPQATGPSGDAADTPRSRTAASPVSWLAAALLLLVAGIALPILGLVPSARAQALEPDTRSVVFGVVTGNAPAERPLVVVNRGAVPVRIRSIEATPPLSLSGIPEEVAPGESARIVVRLGEPRTTGRYEGSVTVGFESGGAPLAVDVSASIVTPVEIVPAAGLVASTERGTTARASVEIVNNLGRPLELSSGATSNERFATALETVEAGKRYRLNLVMSGKGVAGNRLDAIHVETADPELPVLRIPVRTELRERPESGSDRVDAVSRSGPVSTTVQ